MNRIVLIGNGFDKAHGLPTGYSDFMNYLKNSIAEFDKKSTVLKPIKHGKECGDNSNYIHRTNNEENDRWLGVEIKKSEGKIDLKTNPHAKSIYFKSLFEENENLGYWSDLEAHYFKLIYNNKDSAKNIDLINEEFDHLKELLFEYLKKVENETSYLTDLPYPIYNMLDKAQHNNFEFNENYFITFNYTSTILNAYYNLLSREFGFDRFPLLPIHIHGELENTKNPIIFGYGDENSEKYKELELLQNNDLLKNFKTFQYLRSTKYKQVLGLLEESDEIYIQLIGHSSGLCDKALLRTIFQHENVKHIEATYHKEDSKYFENLYNISRIFDDNTLMREKIIPLNKTSMIQEYKRP